MAGEDLTICGLQETIRQLREELAVSRAANEDLRKTRAAIASDLGDALYQNLTLQDRVLDLEKSLVVARKVAA